MNVSFGKIYAIPYGNNVDGLYEGIRKVNNLSNDIRKSEKIHKTDTGKAKVDWSYAETSQGSYGLLYLNDSYKKPVDDSISMRDQHLEDSIPIDLDTTADDILRMEEES